MIIDYQTLWAHITSEFACDLQSVHGPRHWRRVERNGLLIALRNGGNVEVVKLFAVFHDSRREHDGWDNTHGERASGYAAQLRGVLFDLPDAEFDLLRHACTWHTHGQLSNDPTIGACWDADRLDLGRVGINPESKFMSTPTARKIARFGSVEDFISKTGAA